MITIYYSIYLVALSLITFIFYGIDKGQAKKGGYRISEKFLLTLSLIGGAIGGTIGMKVFRHKTKHWYFTALNFLGIILHIGILIFIAFYIKV